MFNTTKDYRTVRASRVRNERGVATSEYAIMLFLVSLAVAGFGDQISGAVTGVFEQVMTTLT
jgi:Flp pilus assembly pilin Flp